MFDFSVRFEAIDAISKKIDAINKKMKSMADKAQEVSSKVKSRVGNMKMVAVLKMNTQKALAKLRTIEQRVKRIGEGGKSMAQNGVARLVAGASMVATMLQPLNVARKYELAFKDVKKAVDGTPEQLAQLRSEMKAFAGASFDEISQITAEAGKMGFSADKVMAFSDSVIKGAKALDFNAELAVGQVGKILAMTNQMNTAVESGSDIMNKVVNLENKMAGVKGSGVIGIWKRNADLYASLNFDNAQMGAMSGFLEQSFVSSELGASGFKMMINQFKKLEGEFGFLNRIQTKGLDGLKDVMDEISKMSPEQQIKKFGSGAMELIAKLQNQKNIAKLEFALEVSKSSAGAVQAEWDVFRATFDERLNDSQKKVSNMMDTIGSPMKKIASDFLAGVNPIMDKITDWVSKNKELTATIMKWGAVIGGVLAVLGVLAVVMGVVGMAVGALSPLMLLITGKFGLLTIATWLFNTALWANPITWVVAGVIALIAVVIALVYYWEEITAWVTKLWNEFMALESVKAIMYGIKLAVAGILLPFILLWNAIKWVGEAVWGLLTDIFSPVVDSIVGLVTSIVDSVSSLWNEFMEVKAVQDAIGFLGDAVKLVFDSIMLPFRLWLVAWGELSGWVSEVWDKFGGFNGALGLVESAIGVVGGAFDALIAPIKNAIEWIDSFLSKFDIYNKAKAKVSGAITAVKDKASAVGNSISESAGSAWSSAKSWVGLGDSSETSSIVDNTVKNHTVVDVNVTATGGAKADTASRSNGVVRLRTVENGIGG